MDNARVGDVVLVTNVDEFGFCGRERHPSSADVGVTGEVTRVERFTEDNDPDGETAVQPGAPALSYTICTVLTYEPEPRYLDMLEWELERNTKEVHGPALLGL